MLSLTHFKYDMVIYDFNEVTLVGEDSNLIPSGATSWPNHLLMQESPTDVRRGIFGMLKFEFESMVFQNQNYFSFKVHWVPAWRLYLYRTLAQPPVGCLPSYQVKLLLEDEH